MKLVRSLGRHGKQALRATARADIVALVPPEHREMARGDLIWARLRSCAHPDLYVAQLGPGDLDRTEVVDTDWAVAHFLAHGARAGRRICALFNPGWYLERLAERGRTLPDGVIPFFDWLTTGWEEHIVPTPLFDEEFYREHHPGLSGSWLFPQYLTRGCYRPGAMPSPVGRHHPGAGDPTARERRRPLLLREMLHRHAEFDLARTSWLEEGCAAALRRYATLGSASMQEQVAKAAAIDPEVTATAPERRRVSCPPHRHPRLYLSEQVEALRVGLGQAQAHTVVLVPTVVPGPELERSLRLAREHGGAVPGTVLAGTDLPGAPDRPPEDVRVVDLAGYADGLGDDQVLAMLVDLVRGLAAHRVVVGSRRGRDLLAAYGRQLSHEVQLLEADPPAEGS